MSRSMMCSMSQRRAQDDLYLKEYIDPETQLHCREVGSLRYPDAPPHRFCNPSDRCNCVERVAEQDMCAHEIKAHKGFNPALFESRQMFRECVTGSLEGWVEDTSSTVDNILGYETEPISFSLLVAGGSSEVEDAVVGSADDPMNVETVMEGASVAVAVPPPGYLPESAGRVKPLDTKGIQNIMNSVCSGYSSCNDEKKFAISALAIQLQNMMCLSKGEAVVMQSEAGDTLMVPKKDCLLGQSKNRKKPRHEIEAYKAKKKSKNSLVVNTSAVAATIVGKENNILAIHRSQYCIVTFATTITDTPQL